jgi:hypothetical protein
LRRFFHQQRLDRILIKPLGFKSSTRNLRGVAIASKRLGAPGSDFGTWESTNQNQPATGLPRNRIDPRRRGKGRAHFLLQRRLHALASALEPVINFRAGGAGRQFFRVLGARSDAYRVSASDERQRNRENWSQPFGLRRKSGHTSLSPSTLEPPKTSGSASSGPIFARNAAHGKVNNRL